MSKQKTSLIAASGAMIMAALTGLCGCNIVTDIERSVSSEGTTKTVEIIDATKETTKEDVAEEKNETEIIEKTSGTEGVFEGEWHRTNTHSSAPATITISNVSTDGFDFSGFFQGYGNMGEEEGRAYFESDNVAVYTQEATEYFDEAYIYFTITDGDLEVMSEGTLTGMGNHVFADGMYTTDEPTYTNANVLAETFTDEELQAMKDMLSEEDYTKGFVDNTETGIVTSEQVTMYDGLKAKHVNSFFPGLANFVGYDLLITEDGKIYYLHVDRGFATNDPNYLGEEMPEFTVD